MEEIYSVKLNDLRFASLLENWEARGEWSPAEQAYIADRLHAAKPVQSSATQRYMPVSDPEVLHCACDACNRTLVITRGGITMCEGDKNITMVLPKGYLVCMDAVALAAAEGKQ